MGKNGFRLVLGLMSGTSMDGVDAALIRTDGVTVAGFERGAFLAYSEAEREVLRAALGLWPEAGAELEPVREIVERRHIEAVRAFPEAELVGFHGQTLAHDPVHARSFQIGRGDVIAAETGRPVVWDFRSADLLSGGEGAPLVPFFHFACARAIGAEAPLAFCNIGGVANVTWVGAGAERPEVPGALLAFDTGPGNALIDDFILTRLGQPVDTGGALAAEGRVDEAIVARALAHPYLSRMPPKSLDRNEFHEFMDLVQPLGAEDGLATLTAITAATIAASLRHMPEPPERWLICGGGRHNRTLMRMLAERTNLAVDPVESEGFDGDMFEAQAFAYLADRVSRGLATSAPGTTGCRIPVSGGRISRG